MKKRILIPLFAGLALLWACKGKDSSSETADTASATSYKAKNVNPMGDTIQSHAKLVKTADMRFQVKNVQQTTEQITTLTESLNGTVMHHVMKRFRAIVQIFGKAMIPL